MTTFALMGKKKILALTGDGSMRRATLFDLTNYSINGIFCLELVTGKGGTMYQQIFSDAEVKDILASCKRDKFDLNTFMRSAREKNQWKSFSSIVLVSTIIHGGVRERHVGELIAIQKGVVLLIGGLFSPNGGYSAQEYYRGFLQRVTRESSTEIVEVGQTFHGKPFNADSSFTNREATEEYPGMLYWDIGSGHGESYGRELFDPVMWHKTIAFLDRWLPPDGK